MTTKLINDLNDIVDSVGQNPTTNALALLHPSCTEEVSNIMKVCHHYRQTVVLQGGMTGLVDGAAATPKDVALSLSRLTGIESIDVIGKTMTVAAGTILQTVQEVAEKHGLMFAVDWGARGSATIGGAVATNAGGNTVLRFGMMRENILGLEVVLPDGTILSSMNALMKNNTGYDLKQLFIGSEGTLGVVTRAVLKLHALPKARQTALVALSSFDNTIALLGEFQSRLQGNLNAFEVMWHSFYEMVVTNGEHQCVLPIGHQYYAVIEAEGGEESILKEQFETILASALDNGHVVNAVICQSEAQREAIWNIREDIYTVFGVLYPPITFDVSLPIMHMESYVENVYSEISTAFPEAQGVTFGHLGDGNLHFCWSVGNTNPSDSSRLSQIVYDNLIPYNGSVSAEHGIGLSKGKYLSHSRTQTEILWMKKVKALFDPQNLLNPACIFNISPEARENESKD